MSTRRSLRPLLVVSCILVASAAAQGQRPRPIAPDVETVVTGGVWQRGKVEGRLRAVIRSSGFEHMISRVTIDWITNDSDTDTAKVVASITPETGPLALFDPKFERVGETWVLSIRGADTHTDPPRRSAWRIEIGAPGVVRARQVSP